MFPQKVLLKNEILTACNTPCFRNSLHNNDVSALKNSLSDIYYIGDDDNDEAYDNDDGDTNHDDNDDDSNHDDFYDDFNHNKSSTIAYVVLLLINMFISMIYLISSISNGINNSSGSTFGLSIVLLFVFSPCSFVCWFRPLYNAFRFAWLFVVRSDGNSQYLFSLCLDFIMWFTI